MADCRKKNPVMQNVRPHKRLILLKIAAIRPVQLHTT